MKRLFVSAAIVAAFALALNACSSDDTGPSAGVGTVTGFVKDASSQNALAGVTVEGTIGTEISDAAVTGSDGKYELRFDLDSTMTAKISIRNYTGYRDTTNISISVKPNEASLRDVSLNPKSQVVGSGGSTSGLAQTIAFLGANPGQVSVYGVGGQETSVLGFEARDSLGIPIDAAHAVQIRFSLLGGPNGGEYVSPSVLTTNAIGRAFIAFNSGIRAGVVQVVASATVGARTITSAPVRLVINAGFAVQDHFTISAEKFNFPSLGISGLRDKIGVLVGDRYSNPVVQGTAVYFRTGAGVVQPTVFTSVDGQGAADLISGNPQPLGVYAAQPYGNGYHWVVARTIGEGGAAVQDSVLILWSGASNISTVSPTTFNIPNAGFQDFTFTVSDYLGHPLSAGTKISVVATVAPPPNPDDPINQVLVGFGRNGVITLPDVIVSGQGTTEFGFRLSDGTTSNAPPGAVTVSIVVESQNGSAYRTINGICN
ncbi:MAG: hypothetical protein HY961_17245 [Ignavibacteriae bacterium]|nr:hypothetical protein [Ignavibacteriota bacterium]